MVPPQPSYVEQLETKLGRNWSALRNARTATNTRREQLRVAFKDRTSPDTSLVVFGSVAREEVTIGSDLDWLLLIDGQSAPEHKNQERDIDKILLDGKFIKPGSSGVFGKMIGSHDLVHNIGGEDDLNSNTTRRVLLLLESWPVGNDEAHQRVLRQILRRYTDDDRGLTHASSDTRIPRFLLNDLTRYWRTVAVDFVFKQRDTDKKWAIRNAKLRMSRKLLFAAGLAIVFLCHFDPDADNARHSLRQTKDVSFLVEYLERRFSLAPLEVIAHLCDQLNIETDRMDAIFGNYDRFLAILDDPAKREELEQATGHDDLRNSQVWKDIRDISHPFHAALVSLFLKDNEQLSALTMEYGLF